MVSRLDKYDTIIYGKAGSGKTVLAATAEFDPRSSKVYYICFQESPVSLRGSGVEPIVINTIDELYECYEYLATQNTDYKAVVIDTITTVHRHIFQIKNYNVENMANFSDFKATSKNVWDGYYFAHELIEVIMKKFTSLPIHVIFLAHAENKKDAMKNDVVAPSFMGPDFWLTPCKWVNNVWFLGRNYDTGERILLLDEDGSYYAKTSAGFKKSIPTELINPEMSDIWNALSL